MSQEAEPSLIDYARFHGLIRDHLGENPLEHVAPPRDILAGFEDNASLFQIRADSVRIPDERLYFDEDTASLLSITFALAQRPPSRHSKNDEVDVHRVRRMKQELPLLRTDPELDLLRFAPKIVPDLENEFLPLETVDEEADEGFEWPTWCHSLPAEYAKKLRAEKLEITSDTLAFLQEALKSQHHERSPDGFDHVELPYTKRTKILPVSPPLLPGSPETLAYLPSSETGAIEPLSDHTSPTRDEAREAERLIFADDAIQSTREEAVEKSDNSDLVLLDSAGLDETYDPLKSFAESPLPSPEPRRSLTDRKVEVPLSPPISEQPPWKQNAVPFCEALSEAIGDIPPPIPNPENVSSDDIDAFFEESIRPIGIQAERRIEQERLQEADTTLRVKVPIMDFSLPIAPWKAVAHGASKPTEAADGSMMNDIKNSHFTNHMWPLAGKIERTLKWSPFPAALGKVANQETISDDAFIERYLAQPDRVDIETLTWKPEGLRLLDALAESDEELGGGTFPDERDFGSLIRKRKYELEAHESVSLPAEREDVEKRPKYQVRQNQDKSRSYQFELPERTFSALSALDNYIGVRQGTIQNNETVAAEYFANPSEATAPTESPKQPTNTELSPFSPSNLAMPTPKLNPPTTPTPFIISVSVLNNRKLIRQIQRLYPSADFIERDFNLHLDRPALPSSSSKPKATSTAHQSTLAADEADMILSPTTGLFWTTLQKIKQRSLPGQTLRSPVKERIARTSPRYERLIFLVHESCNDVDLAPTTLAEDDCTALIDLITFCSSLPTDIQLLFIPGTDDNLAQWIVALMIQYSIPTTSITITSRNPPPKLLQEETIWEIFLRRAGMNAFAAQVVLGELKAPEGYGDDDGGGRVGEFGLGAFVRMGAGERVTRFEGMLGGRRVLERVGRVLDAQW